MQSNRHDEIEPSTEARELQQLLSKRKRLSLTSRIGNWLGEQVPLAEALFIAVSLHVVALPCVWFIGWALPWPKTPVVTTIIEWDLTDWAKTGKPKKVLEIHRPELNQ